jgi:YHS domain-containing protein
MLEKTTNLGLDGFDPLTFFDGSEPQRGQYACKTKVDGKIYLFLNAENRGRFQRNPGSFLPQFSGFCAFALGLYGGLVPGTTEHRKVLSGKLFLFQGPKALRAWEAFPKLIEWGYKNYDRKFKIKTK